MFQYKTLIALKRVLETCLSLTNPFLSLSVHISNNPIAVDRYVIDSWRASYISVKIGPSWSPLLIDILR